VYFLLMGNQLIQMYHRKQEKEKLTGSMDN
jgi:hypothetical protein